MVNKKHLIVVSVDAMVYEDLEFVKDLPMFGKFLKEGSLVERVRTLYPSLTHPVHATIMSGCPASVTGIINNTCFQPGVLDTRWYNHMQEMNCETIFHAAHRAELTTAAICWPLTANAGEEIDYLIPCVMELDTVGYEDEPIQVYRNLGVGENIIDIVEEGKKRYGYSLGHPDIDNFLMYCTVEIFRRYKPNVLFTHPCHVDGARHRTGVFSEEVKIALREVDEWLALLWDEVVESGLENETDIIILSDHGQMGITRTICPNVFLKDAGYIKTDAENKLIHWDAYATSGGLSAQVYLARPEDEKLYQEVKALLEDMAREQIYGFERVFTREEVKNRYDLDGEFSFVLETDGFTSFSDDWVRPAVRPLDISDYRFGRATHGHMPEKGPQPIMIGFGPSIKKGMIIPEGHILDQAVTFAKILGIELPMAQGKVVDFIN